MGAKKVNYTSEDAQSLEVNHEFSWLALSVLLMLCFVQGYPIWAYLYRSTSSSLLIILPIAAALICILVLFTLFAKHGIQRSTLWLVPVILFIGIGLYLPDAAVPSKRIHVAQYMMLAILVRKALSFRHGGVALLIWTLLVTAILGIHDEILQGLHVQRYYGLRDMVVNLFGALSGAVLGYMLGMFEQNAEGVTTVSITFGEYAGVLFLTASVVAWVVSLQSYLGTNLPIVTTAPLIIVISAWFLFKLVNKNKKDYRTPNIVFILGAATLIVPVLCQLLPFQFL